MKTQYYTATSLDGFIADTDNSLSWLMQFGEGPGDNYKNFIDNVGALAMGSVTYEWLLEHMINPGADMPQPWPYKMPTWVFTSRDLPSVPGADIRFTKAPIPDVHAEMSAAAAGKNVWIVGGGELVGQFHDHGLLDELLVSLASVTLGAGAQILPRRIATPPLKLISVEQWGSAFVHLIYEVPKKY